jgi:hypothetical protein
MASKRNVRRKQCAGKVKYTSANDAWAALRHLRGRLGTMQAYHCTFCGGWHLGHYFERATSTSKR